MVLTSRDFAKGWGWSDAQGIGQSGWREAAKRRALVGRGSDGKTVYNAPMLIRLAVFLLLLLPACAKPEGGGSETSTQAQLQFLSFNIRYGTADDGANSWPARKELVADIISDVGPDVLAIQEALDFQLDDLADVLSEYVKVGVHRGGGTSGEFSGLYIHPHRLKIFQSGTLWLSDQPDVVASKGWDAALPRTAIWADLQRPDESKFRVYGTHFDHVGKQARLESARLIRSHADCGLPVIIMGDLNAEEKSPPLQEFLNNGYQSAILAQAPGSTFGTFNGFEDPTGGRRIDHILYTSEVRPSSAIIHTQQVDGIFPSDHFPVSAVLGF